MIGIHAICHPSTIFATSGHAHSHLMDDPGREARIAALIVQMEANEPETERRERERRRLSLELVKIRRNQALEFLGSRGRAGSGVLCSVIGCWTGPLKTTMNHCWFEKTAKGWILSESGKSEYARRYGKRGAEPESNPVRDLVDLRWRILRWFASRGKDACVEEIAQAVVAPVGRVKVALDNRWFVETHSRHYPSEAGWREVIAESTIQLKASVTREIDTPCAENEQ